MESSSDRQLSPLASLGVCSDRDLRRPMLLCTLGSCAVDLFHASSEKLSDLPCPFGPVIRYVNHWFRPLIVALEQQSLGLLAFADEQICALGYAVERYVPHSSLLLNKLRKLQVTSEHALIVVSATLKRRGLIGFTVDSWARYQLVVKNSAVKAVSLANRVPLLSMITPTFCFIVTPMIATASDWLLKHSEQIKPPDCLASDLQTGDDKSIIHLKDMEPKSGISLDKSKLKDGEVIKEYVKMVEDKSIIHLKDMQPTSGISLDKSKLKDGEVIKEYAKMVEDEDDAGSSYEAKGEKVMDSLVEMMDSGWIMGSSAFSSKATGQPKLFKGMSSYN